MAIDGSKLKAVNNRDRNFTKGKIASRIAHLEASVARYLDEMVRVDRQEQGEAREAKVTRLGQRFGQIQQEIQRLRAIERQLDHTADGQISLTDPDARAMATRARHSGHVGYNVQTAVDAETHLIVAHEVTNVGQDRDQLARMAKASKDALDRNDLTVLADKGYFSGTEVLACHEQGITLNVSRPETSGDRVKGMFVKADFAYDAEHDLYRCPAGDELTYRYTTEEDGLTLRRYWTSDCHSCPIKARCTTGKERRITRWQHEHLIEDMARRMAASSSGMLTRRSTVEHPFGTIKAWMGATHFRMRTLRNVRTDGASRPRLQHQENDRDARLGRVAEGDPRLRSPRPPVPEQRAGPFHPTSRRRISRIGGQFPHSLGGEPPFALSAPNVDHADGAAVRFDLDT